MTTTRPFATLETSAMLVQLSISQWAARKRDKRATQQVAAQNGAAEHAGNYNKALLPMDTHLAAVHSKTGEVRNWFYSQTLPWGLDGSRLLPSDNYMEFVMQLDQHKQQWQQLVHEFLQAYASAVHSAQISLGALFDKDDYPDVLDVAKKFDIDVAVFPVPSTDFRVQVGEQALNALAADVERRVKAAEQTAMADLWQRLYECVEKLTTKLADPKAIFRDSLVENARAICELLPRLNVANDSKLEDMRQRVVQALDGKTPEMLRRDEGARSDTASATADIMRQMGALMGGMSNV